MGELDKRRLVRTLQELVRIDSSRDIGRMSDYVEKKLDEIGFKVIRDSDSNLVSEIGMGEGFLLNAHLDTVKADWKGALSGTVRNGRVYGRGSSDCKAGVAAMLEIANFLREKELDNRVVFAFTGNEENKPLEINGAYKLVKKISARRGIVLEPTTREDGSIEIAIGCKGSYRFNIDILGKRCHSGYPERGENAIYNACSFISEFKKIRLPHTKIKDIGKVTATASITQIYAKEGANVIPGRCSVTVDYRALPEEEESEITKKVRRICIETLGRKYKLTKLSGIQGDLYQDKEFLDECKKSIVGVGAVPKVYFSRGRNDSGVFHKYGGIGCYVIGPGTHGQAHKINEYCDIAGLLKTTEAVLKIVEEYAVQ